MLPHEIEPWLVTATSRCDTQIDKPKIHHDVASAET
jgi:hypothetical protein